jgi:hypothetical protein
MFFRNVGNCYESTRRNTPEDLNHRHFSFLVSNFKSRDVGMLHVIPSMHAHAYLYSLVCVTLMKIMCAGFLFDVLSMVCKESDHLLCFYSPHFFLT